MRHVAPERHHESEDKQARSPCAAAGYPHGDQPGGAGYETSTSAPSDTPHKPLTRTARCAAPSRHSATRACIWATPDRRQPGPATTPGARHAATRRTTSRRHEACSASRTAAEKTLLPRCASRRQSGVSQSSIRDQTSASRAARRDPGRLHETGPVTPRRGRRGRGASPGESADYRHGATAGGRESARAPAAAPTTPARPHGASPRRRPHRDSTRPSQPTGQSRDRYREQRIGVQPRPTSASEEARQRRIVKRERDALRAAPRLGLPYHQPHPSSSPARAQPPLPIDVTTPPRHPPHLRYRGRPARPDGRAQGSTSCSRTGRGHLPYRGAGSTSGRQGGRL